MAALAFVGGLVIGFAGGFIVSTVLAEDDDQRRWR